MEKNENLKTYYALVKFKKLTRYKIKNFKVLLDISRA